MGGFGPRLPALCLLGFGRCSTCISWRGRLRMYCCLRGAGAWASHCQSEFCFLRVFFTRKVEEHIHIVHIGPHLIFIENGQMNKAAPCVTWMMCCEHVTLIVFFFYFSRYRSVFFIKLLYYHPFFYLFLTVPVFSIKLLYSRSLFTLTSKLVDHLFCRWAHETFHPFPDSPRPAMRASVAAAATQTGWHNKKIKSYHCLKEPVHSGPLSLLKMRGKQLS